MLTEATTLFMMIEDRATSEELQNVNFSFGGSTQALTRQEGMTEDLATAETPTAFNELTESRYNRKVKLTLKNLTEAVDTVAGSVYRILETQEMIDKTELDGNRDRIRMRLLDIASYAKDSNPEYMRTETEENERDRRVDSIKEMVEYIKTITEDITTLIGLIK